MIFPRHIIIGGAGFLGVELVKQLVAKSASVVVIDIDARPGIPGFFDAHQVPFIKRDIAAPNALEDIPLGAADIVHHLASKLIIPNKPRFSRFDHFARPSVDGTKHILAWMQAAGCSNLVFWSTDMVYGLPSSVPVTETVTPRPLGPYGRAKVIAEDLITKAVAATDLKATVFRPRLIIGPGRLGILEKLFRLVRSGYPVPMIGSGKNIFQFVSVEDCARASILAAEQGCPQGVFNLSSDNSPCVKDLLGRLIDHAGSRSRLLPVPAVAVKSALEILNLVKIAPMDQEQFRIADQNIVLSTEKTKKTLSWHPEDNDSDMLIAAFEEYCRVTEN